MAASPGPSVIFSTLTGHGHSGVLGAAWRVLTALTGDASGIAIAQHAPDKLTALYAVGLNGLCAIAVRKARGGDRPACRAAAGPHAPVCGRGLAVSAWACIKACCKWLPKP